ncbi:hypothetical protein LUX05_21005 [Streptomyces somaliensis]|nr:hypothetical protein [Streptomyces somaliensis]
MGERTEPTACTPCLYALVEHLRAAAPHHRSAPDPAARFEASVRTIARDLAGRGKFTGRAGGPPAGPTAVGTVIGGALHHRERVRIDYTDARGRASTREAEPGLLLTTGEGRQPADGYLAGWCRLRQGAR